MSSGQLTLYVATSVDGFLADDEGGVAWLDEFEQAANGDTVDAYEDFFASVDCLVMGARTYEQILTFGEWPYEARPTYVFTHRDLPRATDAVEFVDGDAASVATDLRGTYDHIWVVGGAQLAQEFLRAQQIDDLRLSIVPVLLGSGIPLFAEKGETQRLDLLDTTRYSSGIVELHYSLPT